MDLVLDTVGDAACHAAEAGAEAACQGVAVANFEDGIGEGLEAACDVLGWAFEMGCEEAERVKRVEQWKEYVKGKACESECR